MNREFLERRNALWRTLREHTPGEASADAEQFKRALRDLMTLTGWTRPQILAGLGLTEQDLTALGLAEAEIQAAERL